MISRREKKYNKFADKFDSNLAVFNDAYSLNKNNIKMPNSGQNKLSDSKVDEYIQKCRECNTKLGEAANYIFNNTRYITFNEFYESLKKYVIKIYELHGRNINVNFILGDETYFRLKDKKSNLWVSFLIKLIIEELGLINFNITGLVDTLEHFSMKMEKDNDITTIGIYPDDCIYSGMQSSYNIFCGSNFSYSRPNNIYMLVPYVGNYAKKVFELNIKDKQKKDINSFRNIIFLEDCVEYIPTFPEVCVKNNYNLFKADIYFIDDKSSFPLIKTFFKHVVFIPDSGLLIYFDHKIADKVSTIQYFLNYSNYLKNINILNISENLLDDAFTEFKKKHNIEINHEYELQMIYGGEYNENFLGILDREFKDGNIQILDKITCGDKDFISPIDNCELQPYEKNFSYKSPSDLRKTSEICYIPYYKNVGIMMLDSIGGGYYSKYLKIKKDYLLLKNKS